MGTCHCFSKTTVSRDLDKGTEQEIDKVIKSKNLELVKKASETENRKQLR